jgi:hypothetical protein
MEVNRMGTGLPRHASSGWWQASDFVRSLPLFISAVIFFTAGIVLRLGFPAYADYGPGGFTLLLLLLALGFTCSIGGVISWTVAVGSEPPAAQPTTPSPSPAYLPIDFPEPAESGKLPEPPRPTRARSDFGRPAPDIRATAAVGDWHEEPTDSERSDGPPSALPLGVQPFAKAGFDAAAEEVEPVEKVLADLERMERDLAPRARVVDPSPS